MASVPPDEDRTPLSMGIHHKKHHCTAAANRRKYNSRSWKEIDKHITTNLATKTKFTRRPTERRVGMKNTKTKDEDPRVSDRTDTQRNIKREQDLKPKNFPNQPSRLSVTAAASARSLAPASHGDICLAHPSLPSPLQHQRQPLRHPYLQH